MKREGRGIEEPCLIDEDNASLDMIALSVLIFPIRIMNGNTREAGQIDDTMKDAEKGHCQTIL
jgi:hypothetical protein